MKTTKSVYSLKTGYIYATSDDMVWLEKELQYWLKNGVDAVIR